MNLTFDFLESSKSHRNLRLIDIVVFEVSTRLCAQSLFLANSAFFLNLSLQVLIEMFGSDTVYNIKFKAKHVKNEEEAVTSPSKKKLASVSSFVNLCVKQTVTSKNINLIQMFYLNLFKSITLQNSNFTNKNSHNEIEALIGKIYAFLCDIATRPTTYNYTWFFENILSKFISSNFNNSVSTSVSPSKLSNGNMQSFYQFSFKYLIFLQNLENSANQSQMLATQTHTLQLYSRNVVEFLEFTTRSADLFNSLLLIISSCLTSESEKLRFAALDLFEKVHAALSKENLENNSWWVGFVKRMLKNRQEISIDGSDYVRTKSLNKILSSESDNIYKILNFFLGLNRSNQNQRFMSSSMAYFMNSDLSLVKFKYSLLDLFKNAKDEYKFNILESLFNFLIKNLNDSASLLEGSKENSDRQLEIKINKSLIETLVNSYLVTTKSYSFLNDNQKFFDFLVGYLNNNNDSEANFMIKHFKSLLIQKLYHSNRQVQFFQQLNHQLQACLLKSCFDLHLSGSLKTDSNDEQIVFSVLLTFDLSSTHFICLFKERAHLEIVNKTTQKETGADLETTKQMKKQMLSGEGEVKNERRVEWRALKAILELIQSILIQNDNQMETDSVEHELKDTFIDLIPYLFLGNLSKLLKLLQN